MLIVAVALVVAIVLAVVAILAPALHSAGGHRVGPGPDRRTKAIGAPHSRIRSLYAIKYLTLSAVGASSCARPFA